MVWEDNVPPTWRYLPHYFSLYRSLLGAHMVALRDNLTRALLHHFNDPSALTSQQAADMVVIISEGLVKVLNNSAVAAINFQLLGRDQALAAHHNNLSQTEKLWARSLPFDSVDLFGCQAKDLKAFIHTK